VESRGGALEGCRARGQGWRVRLRPCPSVHWSAITSIVNARPVPFVNFTPRLTKMVSDTRNSGHYQRAPKIPDQPSFPSAGLDRILTIRRHPAGQPWQPEPPTPGRTSRSGRSLPASINAIYVMLSASVIVMNHRDFDLRNGRSTG
jgi:hypothetical protein